MIFSTPSSGGASGRRRGRLRPARSAGLPGLLRRLLGDRVEVELGVLVDALALALDHVQEADEPLAHEVVADRAQAVRGRVHEPGRGDRLVELLGHGPVRPEDARPHRLLAPGHLGQDLARGLGRDAAEGRLQEPAHVVALRLARREHEGAELDPVGVRLDLDRLLGQLVRGPGEDERLVARSVGARALGRADRPRVPDRRVRVREGGVLDVAVDEALALLPVGHDLELDPGAVLLVPALQGLVVDHHRLVLAGVEPDVEHVGVLAPAHAARDPDRLAGRELPVHRRRRDPDALLAASLLEPVELRAVEQLAEDLRHLWLDDPGAVVLDDHEEAALALGELRLSRPPGRGRGPRS